MGLKKLFSAAIQSKMFMDEAGILWRCIDCSYSSKQKHHVARHIESKHIDTPGFNCIFCEKFCPNSNSLQAHISRNHRNQSSLI